MDDATRLVSELQLKLAELDSRLAAYRQDMAAEFQRYSDQLLQDIPAEVSDEVVRVIAESMSNYPSLSPDLDHSERPESPQSPAFAIDRRHWQGRRSPPPILYHTSGKPKEGPRSPHEREKEFLGLITPSYLPLLDSADRPMHSPPTSPSPRPPSPLEGTKEEPLSTPVSGGPHTLVRPIALTRRATDNTVSSTESTGSDSRARRSALRRSSSSTKGSPRRVRFSVQGAEVSPTASPQGSQVALANPAKGASSAAIDDSPADTSGTSLLDVEGEEDLLPAPKKVSSTQALRALTRSPLEEGTVWTVINPHPEDIPSMNGIQTQPTPTESTILAPVIDATEPVLPAAQPPLKVTISEKSRVDDVLGSPLEDLEEHDDDDEDDDDEDESEEEFLSMAPKSSKKSPPPASRSPTASASSPLAVRTNNAQQPAVPSPSASKTIPDRVEGSSENSYLSVDGGGDEEEVFEFDGADLGIPSKTPPALDGQGETKSPADEDDDEDEEDEDDVVPELPQPPNNRDRPSGTSSPPKPIGVPKSNPEQQQQQSQPSSVRPRLAADSIGSYRGGSLRMDVVVNPRLNEELAQMGAFNSFVGSVDGRSGVDTSDLNSFHASLARLSGGVGVGPAAAGAFSGTPQSLLERLMMEESMENERAGRD